MIDLKNNERAVRDLSHVQPFFLLTECGKNAIILKAMAHKQFIAGEMMNKPEIAGIIKIRMVLL